MKKNKKRILEIVFSFTIGFVVCYFGFVIIPNYENNNSFEQGTYKIIVSNVDTKAIVYDSGNISLDWLINNSIIKDDSVDIKSIKDFCIEHNIKLGEYKEVYIHEKNCIRIFPPCEYWTYEYVSYKLNFDINYFKDVNWINLENIIIL